MVSIRIYIEGAGNANDDDELLPMQRPGFRSKIIGGKETTSSLREGFSQFFQELVDLAKEQKIEFRIVMCGSRADAYENFKRIFSIFLANILSALSKHGKQYWV
ncbi:hypothetical protein H5968_19710 [Sphaerospermopsis sp. LEGE 00249]|uniref:hypothetical protein n=1 Tax=Sphaerospermopsis sp. LEGE 00249 TaxID=1380707 RepID=UPI00164E8E71|nr:hypothetical protein [Sphaerospermopsis sp. LEGE 00249]MBC5797318.1 hypothetical protein [Sphaerospermopsis sp. LEGE 00249]